jgi:hypothetical protein
VPLEMNQWLQRFEVWNGTFGTCEAMKRLEPDEFELLERVDRSGEYK